MIGALTFIETMDSKLLTITEEEFDKYIILLHFPTLSI